MTISSPSASECERFQPLIGDLVDGALDPAAHGPLDRHLAACESCRSLADDLREIRRAALALPARAPRPQVWERIARQLEPQKEVPRPALFWTGARVALATAAVLVVAVVTAVVVVGPRSPSPSGAAAGTAAGPVHVSAPDAVKDIDEHLRIADDHYQQAIAGLEAIVSADQSALDPALAATLQKNLGIIDGAIRESRDALRSQPSSQPAQTSLFDALRQKVALLEDTIALINVMRKGDQAGAARIIGSLSKT